MGSFQGKELKPETAKLRLSEMLCRAVLDRYLAYTDTLSLSKSDLSALLQTQEKDVNAVFALFATPDSTQVDAYLALTGLALLSEASLKAKAQMFFELFDFDHSLSISREEFFILANTVLQALAVMTSAEGMSAEEVKAEVEQTFRKVDASGDQCVSQAEFISFVTKSSQMVRLLGHLHLVQSEDVRPNFGTEDNPEVDSDLESEATRDYSRSDLSESIKSGQRPTAETQFMAVAPWLGTVLNSVPTDYHYSPGDDSAPSASLELEYIYGYRCHDARNNVRYTEKGDVVYHTAGMGIVLESKGNQQRFFGRHRDDIVAFAKLGKGDVVVTGEVGKSPVMCVWNCATLDSVKTYAGVLKHGVTAVAISEEYVAGVGADEDHTLAIYRWTNPSSDPIHVTKVGKAEVFAMGFNPANPHQLAICGLKFYQSYEVTDESIRQSKGIGWGKSPETDFQALTCLAFLGSEVVTGAANGRLFRWQERDLAGTQAVHDGAVLAMAQRWGDEEGVVTGGNDGMVLVLDADLNTLVSVDLKSPSFGSLLPKPKSVCEGPNGALLIGTKGGEIYEHSSSQVTTLMRGHYHQELWGLCVLSQSGRFATAGQDGLLALWDPTNRRQLAAIKLGVPATCCEVDYTEAFLAVGLESGHLLVLQVTDFSMVKRIADRKAAISTVKFSPSGQYMAVGAHDAFIYLYNAANWTLLKRLKGHHSAILGLDFSQDSACLQSVSSSYELLYHDLATGKQDPAGASRLRNERWASWSCSIGWPVQGIWPAFSNGSDINAVRRANSGKVVATADDFGKVKLFKYPCIKGGSAFNAYSGHSSHVTNVDFIGNRLISTGGMDKAVFQWRYLEEDVEEMAVYEGVGYSGAVRIDLELHFDDPPATQPAKEEKKMSSSKRKQKADSQTAKPWTGDLQASKPDLALPPSFNQHPSHSLTLERALGYRGFDSRHNLRVLANGDLVYPAAALAVVMSRSTSSQRFFQLHNDDVVSLAVHPSRTIVATGQVTHVGETAALPVYVWEAGSMRTLACLKGFHRRGVRTLAFSPDGTRLLTIGEDEDHSLAVYEWSSETLLVSSTLDKEAITGAIFTSTDTLVAAGLKMIKFLTISGANCTVQKGILQGKAAAFDPHLCLAAQNGKILAGTQGGEIWTWSGRALESKTKKFDCAITVLSALNEKIYAAGADGTLLVLGADFANLQYFNVKDFSAIPSVRSLDIDPNNADTLILGMKSSEILELSIAKEYSNVRVLATGHGLGELWGLCTHPSLPKAASAGEDGVLAIWNLATGKEERRSKPQSEPIRAVDWSPDGCLIVTGSMKALISLFTAHDLEAVASLQSSFKKGDNWIQAIRFSPSGKLVAFGAHGCASAIEIMTVAANVLAAGQVINIGLSSALTHLDWSADETTLMVNSQAYELKFVDLRTRNSAAASSVKETVWASWTCVLGWPVEFIWPPYSDGSDINSCVRSHNSQVLITSDDFGQVNLFRYPVVFPRQQRLSYKGHSSHVTNVAFSHDDRLVVSAGGLDKTILVWKTDLEYEESESGKVAIVDDISKSFAGVKRRTEQREVVKSGSKVKEITTSRWAGQGFMKPPSGFIKAPRDQNAAPRVHLDLDWVHGYRAKDCRNDVRLLPSGKLIYHMAAVGVVMDIEYRSQLVFTEHTDDITACTVHPSGLSVATGEIGRYPKIRVWETSTCALLYTLSTDKLQKGISDLAFSPSGDLLCATAMDDNHAIALFSTSTHALLFSSETGPDDLNDITFVSENTLATVGVKHYKWWTCEAGLKAKRGIFGDHCNVLFCAGVRESEVYTGCQDGSLLKWSENQVLKAAKVLEKQIDALWIDSTSIICGGKEGLIVFCDFDLNTLSHLDLSTLCPDSLCPALRSIQRTGETLIIATYAAEIYEIKEDGSKAEQLITGHYTPSRKNTVTNEVWGLALFGDSRRYVTGSDDGTIRVWDIAEKRALKVLNLSEKSQGEVSDNAKVRVLALSPGDEILAVGCKSGRICLYEISTWSQIASNDSRHEEISDIKFSPSGDKLAIGGHDNLIVLYSPSDLTEIVTCKGHNSYITHLDWSLDGSKLQSNCGAYELLFWETETGKQLTSGATMLKDEKWHTWTCVVGWPVQGVYPAYSDGTDVNSVDRTRERFGLDEYEVVAAADDFSQVRLFRYPCLQRDAKNVQGKGHSSHVTSVRFTPDCKYLLSTGGDDQAVIQWRVTAD